MYLERELVEKSKVFGFNLSKKFENHLKHLIKQFLTCNRSNNFHLTKKVSVRAKWSEEKPKKSYFTSKDRSNSLNFFRSSSLMANSLSDIDRIPAYS